MTTIYTIALDIDLGILDVDLRILALGLVF